MARKDGEITRTLTRQAIAELVSEGVTRPSVRKVRARIGRGSAGTIAAELATWQKETARAGLPEEMQQRKSDSAAQVPRSVESIIAARVAPYEAAAAALRGELEAKDRTIAQYQERAAQDETTLRIERERATQAVRDAAEARAKADADAERIQELQTRLQNATAALAAKDKAVQGELALAHERYKGLETHLLRAADLERTLLATRQEALKREVELLTREVEDLRLRESQFKRQAADAREAVALHRGRIEELEKQIHHGSTS